MKQTIVGYHTDEKGDWVAELSCGHGQHVRHEPPFVNRPWTATEDGRKGMLGQILDCLKCEAPDDTENSYNGQPPIPADVQDIRKR